MSRRCSVTGTGSQFGNKVSHSNHKTRTRFLPNLQVVSLRSDVLGTNVTLRITAATLRSILTEPKNALIKQFTRLFDIEGIELKFDSAVYDFMAQKALEYKLGARGLRSICESILTDAMYELPSQKVKNFEVTLEYAQRKFSTSKLSMLKVA